MTAVPGPTHDADLTAAIQADPATRDLSPGRHLLDAGYVDAGHLLASAAAGIELVGPVLLDTSWQAAAGEGFDLSGFAIDWERRTVTCPQGQPSRSWSAVTRGASAYIQVTFDTATCRACPVRARWTRAATMPRQLALRPRAEHEALLQARARQTTAAFAAAYAPRAGIEGTRSQVAVGCRARRARYRTLPRVHLGHVALAVASSLQRLHAWWTRTPRAAAGISRFAALAA